MKRIFAAFIAALTTLAGTASAQEKFFIPIGENFKYHIASFEIYISDVHKYLPVLWAENTKYYITAPYNPSDGTMQEAVEKLLRQFAGQFSLPALQNTDDTFKFGISVHPNPPGLWYPFAYNKKDNQSFSLVQDSTGRWRIPEKALTPKMEYVNRVIPYYLPWVKRTETVLHLKKGGVLSSVDFEKKSDDGFVWLWADEVVPELVEEYAVKYEKYPELFQTGNTSWWRGEIILFGESNTFVMVNLQNGVKIEESNPPPYPTGRHEPRITRMLRYGGAETSFFLEGEKGAQLILEFSETLTNPTWTSVVHPYVLLTSNAVSNAAIITHHTSSANGFYRVHAK